MGILFAILLVCVVSYGAGPIAALLMLPVVGLIVVIAFDRIMPKDAEKPREYESISVLDAEPTWGDYAASWRNQ